MAIEKHNSLQFLFLDRARFEEFGEKDGVAVRNVPYELRNRLLKWMWLEPIRRESYFFDDDAGRLVVTRAGWEKYINWVRRALDEKLTNDQYVDSTSFSAALESSNQEKRPTLQQLIREQETEEIAGNYSLPQIPVTDEDRLVTMSREQLEALVPVEHGLVNLADIPEPYRTEFSRDSIGSTLPDSSGGHYARDWRKWLSIRFKE